MCWHCNRLLLPDIEAKKKIFSTLGMYVRGTFVLRKFSKFRFHIYVPVRSTDYSTAFRYSLFTSNVYKYPFIFKLSWMFRIFILIWALRGKRVEYNQIRDSLFTFVVCSCIFPTILKILLLPHFWLCPQAKNTCITHNKLRSYILFVERFRTRRLFLLKSSRLL